VSVASPYGVSERQAATMRLGSMLPRATVLATRRLTEDDLDSQVADGRLLTVTLDGRLYFPAVQFERRRDASVNALAVEAFAGFDPSGLTAASWVTSMVSPTGMVWRSLDAYVALDGGRDVVRAMAELDARRLAAE
jgi:hypothetical protein